MREPQMQFAFGPELIVDLFAGGGGASLGIEQAFGRPVDIAVNHDADAIAMHAANHPHTEHMRCDVFEVNPLQATRGRQVGLLWASPDCKHFSKAKGGKPRSKKIRSLAWVVVKWAMLVRPRVIMLENVEEFVTWGPLGPDGMPCPRRKGRTFNRWVRELRRLGYKVEWRELRACDYGAPTIRKRFFLIARCDDLPIRWPKPTHGKPDSAEVRSGKLLPWRSAAECIDFSLPCPSIFLPKEEARALGVKRPLAEATLRRIAKGVDRFVLNNPRPFIVRNIHGNTPADVAAPMPTLLTGNHTYLAAPTLVDVAHAEVGQNGSRRWSDGAHSVEQPAKTVTATGNQAVVSTFLTKYRADNAGSAADAPFPTVTANGESERPGGNPPLAVVAVHMEQANAGNYEGGGRAVDAPLSTITAKGCQQQLVATSLVKLRGDNIGSQAEAPLHTVSAQGLHHAEVRAFLVKFYSAGGQHAGCDEPMHTVPTRDRMGLVTVEGTDYAIADIGLRMLTPRELFRAQGFPENYVIDRGVDGRRLPKDAQVRMCGNSVCPPMARALVEANVGELRRVEAAVYA
ncbi:MAG TPA: DNA cytosine methyltransferase [Lysobacter sp.]|nr:DNA cytosine methyltransferase [Lysobacter sp.]